MLSVFQNIVKSNCLKHLRNEITPVMKDLAHQKKYEILEGKLTPDHVHMLIAIPPKYSVSSVIVFIKGKTEIYIARNS